MLSLHLCGFHLGSLVSPHLLKHASRLTGYTIMHLDMCVCVCTWFPVMDWHPIQGVFLLFVPGSSSSVKARESSY